MGKREDYTKCMIPHMKGGGPDRKERFCVGAKLCSGKAGDEGEAKRLCAEAAANPKPPKKPKGKKICTLRDLEAITTCVVESIDLGSLTPENMGKVFGDALRKCSGGAPAKQRITSAQASIAQMDPQQIKALPQVTKLIAAAGKYGL